MTEAASSTSAGRRPSRSTKRLTLVATILGSSIAILDGSVVSVALPSIERSLGGGLAVGAAQYYEGERPFGPLVALGAGVGVGIGAGVGAVISAVRR